MIQVFSLNKHHFYNHLPFLSSILSENECRLVKNLFFNELQNERIISYSILKLLISKQINLPINEVKIIRTPLKKPYLFSSINKFVQFNVSHSGDYLLISLSRSHFLGVDIEEIKPLAGMDSIAKNHFCDQEKNYLKIALTKKERLERFFSVWCKKEAFLKGLGVGVQAELNKINTMKTSLGLWKIEMLKGPSGYAAAIAYRGKEQDQTIVMQEEINPGNLLL